jgi:5-methyltetrahydrofolate--homocysteine methyltransferase
MSEVLTSISTAVIQGQKDDIAKLIQEALDEGQSARDILYKGLMPGMDHVGDKFKAGDMFVPEVMRSARSMANSMVILKPLLIESGVEMIGKVLLRGGNDRQGVAGYG